jgi:two-component system, OmpR family, phosphate regulon sensor histidine kinase PhoR
MLFSRLFWKLLLACAGLNLAAAVIFGIVVSGWQEAQIIDQINGRLRDASLLARGQLADLMPAGRSVELQQAVRQLGQETGLRFTLVGTDGAVLADSEQTSMAGVVAMQNHRDRPEVIHALARGEGYAQRTSATLDEPYHYFALRAEVDGRPVGVIRTAVTTSSIDAQAAAVRHVIWGLAGVVFLSVFILSYWIVGHIIYPVATLTHAAEAIADGDYTHRVYVPNRDELGMLARSFNRMSQELEARLTQLSESHDRQSTVLGGMIEGVIAVDHRQRIVFANTAAGRLFGFRPPAAEGRTLLEVVRNHELDQAVNTALMSRRPQRLETFREGAEKQLSAVIQATPLPGNPCPGVVLVMHDTTELRRLESLRRDFIANVSHELKTPLTSIKAYAETLRNGALDDPDACQQFLGRIEEQADRLHHLILDMLMLARIESDQQAFEIGKVSVAEVVGQCLGSHRPAAEAKRIVLTVVPAQPECFVRADKEGLREILDNLIDNAIKYTPEAGQITIRWSAEQDMARIEVEDTGIGIAADHLPRVFERFYRVDRARSRELGGTGLGLSIVKHLAQSFGGNVSVQSETGHGSTFAVLLSLA